jgi:hypothetical protein
MEIEAQRNFGFREYDLEKSSAGHNSCTFRGKPNFEVALSGDPLATEWNTEA